MKRVVSHTRNCKRKHNGGCPICKILIELCCYHAKVCEDEKCPVQFCQNIKHKLTLQKQSERTKIQWKMLSQTFNKGCKDPTMEYKFTLALMKLYHGKGDCLETPMDMARVHAHTTCVKKYPFLAFAAINLQN